MIDLHPTLALSDEKKIINSNTIPPVMIVGDQSPLSLPMEGNGSD